MMNRVGVEDIGKRPGEVLSPVSLDQLPRFLGEL